MPFDRITHRPGRLHGNADALYQIPVDPDRKIKKCPSTYKHCPTCFPEQFLRVEEWQDDTKYDVSTFVGHQSISSYSKTVTAFSQLSKLD